MRNRAGQTVRLALLAFISFSASCATQVADLRQSPEFTIQGIVSSGVVMGGYAAPRIDIREAINAAINSGDANVAPAKDIVDAVYAEQISDILTDAIKAKRKGYPINRTGALIQKMGKGDYQKFINEFYISAKLDEKWLGKIRGLNIGGRYLLMAREEHNSEKSIIHKKPAPKNDKNAAGVHHDGSELTLETKRKIKVALTIYDLESGLEVWSGKAGRSKSYTSEQKAYIGSSSVGVKLKGPNLLGKNEPARSMEIEILLWIFGVFAENLPK